MRIGTDIVEIQRIRGIVARKSDFPQRILSREEFDLYQSFERASRKTAFLSGRFSAKEAYLKALGTGIGNLMIFKKISILPDSFGAVQVVAGPVIFPEVQVSISHSDEYAIAMVVINLEDEVLQVRKEIYSLEGDR